jgi:hypothetical protein
MGRWNSEFFAGEPWEENRVGMNVLRHTQDWDAGGPAVLMSDWWVREHWGRAFEVLGIVPQIQNMSWALLRRRDVELTTENLEAPGEDPREHRALRHNLRQVQRELSEITERERHERALREELERLREEHERLLQDQANALAELRSDYEGSLSWQLTAPLRAGARAFRWRRAQRRR